MPEKRIGVPGYHYYRPQTKFAKVMFLHLSVSHSVHGGGGLLLGVSGPGEVPGPGGCLLRGGVCSWGGCLVLGGGVCTRVLFLHLSVSHSVHRGGLLQGVPGPVGKGIWPGGVETPPPHVTATAAGGAHPTGMHSCYSL